MASTVTSVGTVIAGSVVSSTVTVWVAVAEFSSLSVAVQVTMVAPTGNRLSRGASLVIMGAGSTRSLAVAVPNSNDNTGVSAPVASLETAAGAVIVGSVVSTTVTV